jgi:hypothetical protein
MMNRRIKAMEEGYKGYEKYCKMTMNAGYGYDIKNEENFSKVKLNTWYEDMMSHNRNNFLGSRQISEDLFMT